MHFNEHFFPKNLGDYINKQVIEPLHELSGMDAVLAPGGSGASHPFKNARLRGGSKGGGIGGGMGVTRCGLEAEKLHQKVFSSCERGIEERAPKAESALDFFPGCLIAF